MNKLETIELIRRRFQSDYSHLVVDGNECMACLFWAAAVRSVLADCHRHASIVAGSASFQFRTDANDDGKSATHFSYMFEERPAWQRLRDGLLPEMHAWVLSAGELIDVTTGYQEKQMRRLLGKTWDAEIAPPEFLWCALTKVPQPRFVYKIDAAATRIAHAFLEGARTGVLCFEISGQSRSEEKRMRPTDQTGQVEHENTKSS